jgi:hypothetical protein
MTPNVNLVRSQLLENAFIVIGVENPIYKNSALEDTVVLLI